MRDFADDIVAFLKAKSITESKFVGHSMGSFVCQEMALSQPNLVSRIVLVATSTKVAGNPVVRETV